LENEIRQPETEKKNIENSLADGSLAYDRIEPLTRCIGMIMEILEEKEMRWLELNELSSE